MLTDALDRFVARLKQVPGIVAIVVGGSQADFSLLISSKSAHRSDVTYVAGCLFRSIGRCSANPIRFEQKALDE